MQIKTYNPERPATGHHFYVLCKGNNSGRPSATPCPNCFTVSCDTPETKETLYWLTYAMWKGRAFHPFLRGSVIPFITIRDYRKQLTLALHSLQPSGATVDQVVNVLKQLDDQEAQARERIKTISEIRHLVFRKFIRL